MEQYRSLSVWPWAVIEFSLFYKFMANEMMVMITEIFLSEHLKG